MTTFISSGSRLVQLSELPRSLRVLSLPGSLTFLGPEIGDFVHLEHLNLSGNRFVSLPPEIGKLTRLEYLNLSNNQLTSLPPEIGKLVRLISLNLENNQLTSFPPGKKLSKLSSFVLKGNPIRFLPPGLEISEKDRELYYSDFERIPSWAFRPFLSVWL